MMAAKCPLCGAPMEDGSCGYCGYKEKKMNAQGNLETDFQQGEIPQPHMNQNINMQVHIKAGLENFHQSNRKARSSITDENVGWNASTWWSGELQIIIRSLRRNA